MYFGMPTLIEAPKIEDCAKLCHDLGLDFIELNNNFPWYQTDVIDPEVYNDISRRYDIFYTIHLEEELNVCGYNQKVTDAYLATMVETIELAKRINVPVIHMHLHDALGKSNHLALGDGEIDLPDKFALAKECNCRCVLETKTIEGLTKSVQQLHRYLS
jgi:sugar phosphate isomerase/epimerase